MPQDRIRTPEVELLINAIVSIENSDDAYALLQDLCSVREIQDMSQRLSVARMLLSGAPYTRIQAETGASATTISRVNKCINYGMGAYKKALGM